MKTDRRGPNQSPVRAILLAGFLLFILAGCQNRPRSEDDFFIQADRHYAQGRLADAVAVYGEYLVRFPRGQQRDKALFRRGEILYYPLKQRAAAAKEFGLLIEQYPASSLAYEARVIMAGAFRDETHDYRRAAVEYQWLLKQRPQEPRAPEFQFQTARCHLMAESIEQAILEFGKFLEKYPQSDLTDRVYDELGGLYLSQGRPEEAVAIFRRFLNRFPDSRLRSGVEFKMGNAFEEMKLFPEALRIYTGLLGRYENRPAVEIRIAGLKERRKNEQKEARDVDYNYRPAPTSENVQEADGKGKKDATQDNAAKTPVKVQGLETKTRDRKGK